MENIIICDIDGCLVNSSWIWKTITLLGIKDDSTKWDFFSRNANALYNGIDNKLVRFLKYEMDAKNARIMFLTSRSINIEPQTIDFIEKSTGLEYKQDFLISSRPIWDNLATAESKRGRLELIRKFFKPIFAIDDEVVNVDLFDRYGIPTILWTIGFEPKLTEGCPLKLLAEYRAAISLIEQVRDIKFKAYSMNELLQMFEDVVNEINDRKASDEHGSGLSFNLGYKDKNGTAIFTGDILKTPDNTYGTAIWDDRRPAILSPGSNAIDYEDEAFFNSCQIVDNIRKNPDFYENLIPEEV